MTDLAVALTTLKKHDPFVRQRYRRDPQFRADVDEHVRRARAQADEAKAEKRQKLLRTEDARRRYVTDAQFRNDVEVCATAAAIYAIKTQTPDETAPDETKH